MIVQLQNLSFKTSTGIKLIQCKSSFFLQKQRNLNAYTSNTDVSHTPALVMCAELGLWWLHSSSPSCGTEQVLACTWVSAPLLHCIEGWCSPRCLAGLALLRPMSKLHFPQRHFPRVSSKSLFNNCWQWLYSGLRQLALNLHGENKSWGLKQEESCLPYGNSAV